MQTRYKEAALGGLATLNIIECCHSPLDTRRAFQRYTYTMTKEAAELLKKALELPPGERADLASTLIDSLDATVDEDVEASWQEEIRRRAEELRSGKVTPIPWEEVREKAHTLLHEPKRR